MDSTTPFNRRQRPRFRLIYPLSVYRPKCGHTLTSHTQNVSCQGFYFTSEHSFFPSEKLEWELTIANETEAVFPEIALFLRGKAEVVRVEHDGLENRFGVACRLEEYTVHHPGRADLTVREVLVGT